MVDTDTLVFYPHSCVVSFKKVKKKNVFSHKNFLIDRKKWRKIKITEKNKTRMFNELMRRIL